MKLCVSGGSVLATDSLMSPARVMLLVAKRATSDRLKLAKKTAQLPSTIQPNICMPKAIKYLGFTHPNPKAHRIKYQEQALKMPMATKAMVTPKKREMIQALRVIEPDNSNSMDPSRWLFAVA